MDRHGRLGLGVGRGISPIEGYFFGIDAADSPAIYREDLALILKGFEGGEEAREIARRAYKPWRAALRRPRDRHGMKPINVHLPDGFDELAAAGQGIAGTGEEVAAEIRDQSAAAGINYFLCRFAFGDVSLDEAAGSVEPFQARVMEAALG